MNDAENPERRARDRARIARPAADTDVAKETDCQEHLRLFGSLVVIAFFGASGSGTATVGETLTSRAAGVGGPSRLKENLAAWIKDFNKS